MGLFQLTVQNPASHHLSRHLKVAGFLLPAQDTVKDLVMGPVHLASTKECLLQFRDLLTADRVGIQVANGQLHRPHLHCHHLQVGRRGPQGMVLVFMVRRVGLAPVQVATTPNTAPELVAMPLTPDKKYLVLHLRTVQVALHWVIPMKELELRFQVAIFMEVSPQDEGLSYRDFLHLLLPCLEQSVDSVKEWKISSCWWVLGKGFATFTSEESPPSTVLKTVKKNVWLPKTSVDPSISGG